MRIELLLTDSDSLCYANSFSVQSSHGEDAELIPGAHKVLCRQLDDKIEEMLQDTGALDYKLFLTGDGNFREKEYPLYKMNRKDMIKPLLLKEARAYLLEQHNAVLIQGMEADDAVCIEQTLALQDGRSTSIAHIDKDIDQQPGIHYRWAFRGKPSEEYEITYLQGLQNLYQQTLTGDQVDNIMYYFNTESRTWRKEYGVGVKTARKLLKDCSTERDLYQGCLQEYKSWGRTEEDLLNNLHLLFLIKELNLRTGELKRYKRP